MERLFSLHILIVFLIAVALTVGIQEKGITSAYSDPVSGLRAQDESSYVNSVIDLVHNGGWLTPRVLGRLLLYKPPLLVWLSGLSVKTFGLHLWTLRLPSLLAAILATVALFWWALRSGSIAVAWSAAILLLSDPLWHTFARLCYTDMLWVALTVLAMVFVHLDAGLTSPATFWGFAFSVAAGIMTKNVGGLLPLLVLAIYSALAKDRERLTIRRFLLLGLAIAALVAPWHLYQLIVHPKWFWADYVQVQLLGFGGSPGDQTTQENQLMFYLRRISLIDPVLVVATLIALPRLVRKRSEPEALLLAIWLTISIALLCVFRYRNLPYALNVIPPACLIAAMYAPRRILFPALLCLVFILKLSFPQQLWGLSFTNSKPLAAAAGLRSYSDLGRKNELVLVDTDDEFYSSTLPLPRVRYYFVNPNGNTRDLFPHYRYLGIVMSLNEFEHLDQLRPQYAARLREWGAHSTLSIATTIISDSYDDVARLVQASPHSDFYMPVRDVDKIRSLIESTHRQVPLANGRVLLLSLQTGSGAPKYALPGKW